MKGHAHKVRPTLGERPPSPASLLVVDAAELLTLRGGEGPRTREAAQDLGILEDGAVYSEGARIVDVGTTDEVLARHPRADLRIEAAGKAAEVDVVPTFFGAHAVPPEFQARPEAYVNLVREEMLPAVAANRLAESCDAFVDRGYFSAEQAREILSRGADLGFRAKVHADELSDAGGALLAAELEAASADHLIHTSPEGIEALARSRTIAILLPATSLASRLPFADGRRLLAAGVAVAIGTDFNPNCWCDSMPLAIALACHHNGLTPAEAITAATVNAAHAIGRGDQVGVLEPGRVADLVVLDMPSWRHLGYRFGGNAVETVVKRGSVLVDRRPGR